MSEEWADQLDLLIRARAPILWIRSPEEERIVTRKNVSTSPMVNLKKFRLYQESMEGLLNEKEAEVEALRKEVA